MKKPQRIPRVKDTLVLWDILVHDDRYLLGTTFDGVQILKPKGKATHFTTGELRRAIANARATRSG